MYRFILLTALLFSQSILLLAYTPKTVFRQLSTEQGLSQSSVFCITQDSAGFIWLGTMNGLNRYDGYKFKIYRPVPGDSASLTDAAVKNLLADRRGYVWVVMNDGLIDRYDPFSGGFEHFKITHPDSATEIGYISIAEAQDGSIWLAASSGHLFCYDSLAHQFKPRRIPGLSSTDGQPVPLISLFMDKQSGLWLGSREGEIILLDTAANQIKKRLHLQSGQQIITDAVQAFWPDRQRLWVASEFNGLFCYDLNSGHWQNFRTGAASGSSLASDKLYALCGDGDRGLWIGSVDAGLDYYDFESQTIRHFKKQKDFPDGLADNAVMSLYKDRSDNLWIGTFYKGAQLLVWRAKAFQNITLAAGGKDDPGQPPVLAVLHDSRGGLWLGTDGGGAFYQPKNRIGRKQYFYPPGRGQSSCITSLTLVGQSVWLGTDDGVIWRYLPESDSFEEIFRLGTNSDGIVALRTDHKNRVWVGTVFSGLYCLDEQGGLLKNYRHTPADPAGLSSDFIYSLYEDRQGYLWIGTRREGLNRLNPQTETFACFRHDPSKPEGISDNTVFCADEDEQGNLWLATWAGGLNRFDFRDGKFTRFNPSGVSPGILNSAQFDSAGLLWLGTSHGLIRFDPSTGESLIFDQADGLLNTSFSPGAVGLDRDGLLYFGGINGLSVFDPDDLDSGSKPAPVVLTGLQVFDQPFDLKLSREGYQPLSLRYDQNFITFKFAALDFSAPGRNRFACRLDGVDKDWVYLQGQNEARYTNIAPGRYQFRLKAATPGGSYNENEVQMAVIIYPPFWQTWWFRVLGIVFIAAILFGFHQYRLNKMLEIERTRLHIARDLHDEVSATLTGIAWFSSAIARETGESQTPLLQKLLSLIQESISEAQEAMADIIWAVHPKNDHWVTLLPRFRRYISDLCESKNIHYTIEIPDQLPPGGLDMEQRRDLWLLLKELVANTMKHSACTELSIRIYFGRGLMHIVFSDNGRGFDPVGSFEGNGLKNIRSRVGRLSGTAELESAPGRGTTWNIGIKI